MEKKRSVGVTVLGWLLISYGCYLFLYPFIFTIVTIIRDVSVSGIPEEPVSPISPIAVLRGVSSSILISFLHGISGIIQRLATPIGSLVGGIGTLRLKVWSKKFTIGVFCVSLIAKFIQIIIPFTSMPHFTLLAKVVYPNTFFDILLFCLFIIFDISILFFFTRPKIEEQFK